MMLIFCIAVLHIHKVFIVLILIIESIVSCPYLGQSEESKKGKLDKASTRASPRQKSRVAGSRFPLRDLHRTDYQSTYFQSH